MNYKLCVLNLRTVLAVLIATLLLTLAAIPAHAQYFKTLYNFQGSCCATQSWPFVQGRDSNLYGTVVAGGIFSQGGSEYRMTPAGEITLLHNFDTGDLEQPSSPLSLGLDGNFYGITRGGGSLSYGTFFRMTPDGTPSVLYSFLGGSDGAWPYGTLVQAADGKFYGIAVFPNPVGYSIFKISSDGLLTTMCSLDVNNSPRALVQSSDGNFYGTAGQGSLNGTIFKMTPGGQWSVLYSFDGAHGSDPIALVAGPGGNLYGTTWGGGAKGNGVVFMITPKGSLTVLHDFDASNPLDGALPTNLLLASDGYFYGTTVSGGMLGYGTIFRISRTGQFLVLHHFNKVNGSSPSALMQYTNGKMYGATSQGGRYNEGTLFWFDWALKPLVKLEAQSGSVGSVVGIVGNGFLSATSVTFNGVPASFLADQDGHLAATVPYGATTGYVRVVTSSGVAKSLISFKITP